ncbi:hypothetical protein Droror1_Dr00012943 [Drosera rotundifolia]
MRSKKKEKTKVLPEHYVSQKAIDDLCRRAKTVHPTVNYFHGELKSLQQYTRSLDSRLSSLETQVRRASQQSDGGIRDTTCKKSPKKFIKSSDDSKEEFPNSEDEEDPSPSAYIGTMAQQAQKWVSQQKPRMKLKWLNETLPFLGASHYPYYTFFYKEESEPLLNRAMKKFHVEADDLESILKNAFCSAALT